MDNIIGTRASGWHGGGAKLPLWIKKLAEKWEFVEVRGMNSEGRIYRERSEPNLRVRRTTDK